MKLNELYFKNYLLLGSGKISFHDKFNAITGETGAGKSMLIGIIDLLKGDKIIWDRFTEEKNIEVSGVFEHKGEELIVRRSINPEKRRSRFFINDTPVTRDTIIEKIGKHIEISSQHQSSTLLNEETHIDYLDMLIGIFNEREKLTKSYRKLMELKNALHRKQKELKELKEKEEFLKFKLKELTSLNTYEGEEKELEEEIYMLENIEDLKSTFEEGMETFYSGQNSVYEITSSFLREHSNVLNKDRDSKEILSMIDSIMVNAEELFGTFKDKLDNLSVDPDVLDKKRARLFELRETMKKYGLMSTKDILKEIERIKRALNTIGGEVGDIESLTDRVKKAEEEVLSLATKLSQKRRNTLLEIEDDIINELKKLGFPKIKFKVEIEDSPLNEKGLDRVRFLISTSNRHPAPIKYVASGGELSRILLAFKVLITRDTTDKLLIFDEIDTGIGGKTARTVGERLKELSLRGQVIAITHLPQIASLADAHFLVRRDENAPHIKITELTKEERVLEIARMLSGEKITESAIQHAKTLMEEREDG